MEFDFNTFFTWGAAALAVIVLLACAGIAWLLPPARIHPPAPPAWLDEHWSSMTSDVLELEIASGGWEPWNGGECPVPRGTLVDVKHRDGSRYFCVQANFNRYAEHWAHGGGNAGTHPGDIVAWRLHRMGEAKAEPAFGVLLNDANGPAMRRLLDVHGHKAMFLPPEENPIRQKMELFERLRQEAESIDAILVQREQYHRTAAVMLAVRRYLASPSDDNFRGLRLAMQGADQ